MQMAVQIYKKNCNEKHIRENNLFFTEISFNFSHKFRGFYYETLAGTSKSL